MRIKPANKHDPLSPLNVGFLGEETRNITGDRKMKNNFYRLTVSEYGNEILATKDGSICDRQSAMEKFYCLRERFPEGEGYRVDCVRIVHHEHVPDFIQDYRENEQIDRTIEYGKAWLKNRDLDWCKDWGYSDWFVMLTDGENGDLINPISCVELLQKKFADKRLYW